MSTETTTDTLQLSVVVNPRFTMFVQIVFENFSRWTTKRIKILSAFPVDVHRDLMFARSVVRVGVADYQAARRFRQSVTAVDSNKIVRVCPQNSFDFNVVHDEKS